MKIISKRDTDTRVRPTSAQSTMADSDVKYPAGAVRDDKQNN